MSICPLCGAQRRRHIVAWLRICTACGFRSSTLTPHISSEQARAEIDETSRAAALRSLRDANNKTALSALRDLKPQGALLDVGCAHGWFLAAGESFGFTCVGIEPDPAMSEIATQSGLQIIQGYFPDDLESSEKFDIITFNDVFEHLPDINAAIEAVRRHLKPGGIVIINIPASDGPFYRLAELLARIGINGPLERMWQKHFASPHISYFSRKQLISFVQKCGFSFLTSLRIRSLSWTGLWQRLRFDRRASIVRSVVLWCTISVFIPILALLPSDTNAFFFTLNTEPEQ